LSSGEERLMAEKETLFLRRASGLVRAFSVFDGFAYAVFAVAIVEATALSYALSYPWPDANIPLGIVLNCVGLVPVFIVYAALTATMPRSGGEYVWLSRSFGGLWGWLFTFFPWMIGPMFYLVSNAFPGTVMAVSPTLTVTGKLIGNDGLVSLSSWLTTSDGLFAFGVLYSIFAFAIVALGMKWYARLQKISFWLGTVGIITWIGLLLVTSREEFISNFNWFMSTTFGWGGSDPYHYLLTQASTSGYTATPLDQTTFMSSLLIGPVLAYAFAAAFWSGNLTGEIRGVNDFKRSLSVYVGADMFSMIVCAVLIFLVIEMVGNPFMQAASYVWMTGRAASMPIVPFYGLFIMTATRNPLLWIWILIGFNAWFWMWPTNNMLGSTRYMFAMSFDRMLPSVFAKVKTRFLTPIYALVIFLFVSTIFEYLYYYTPFASLTLDMPLAITCLFLAISVTGIVFPYTKRTREMYESSPVARYRYGKVHLISVAGVLGLLYSLFMFVLYVVDPRYGVNNIWGAAFMIGGFGLSAVLYGALKFYRKSRGVQIDKLYGAIPVE
jgi:APA family basic amino acid/polyamine antiporter